MERKKILWLCSWYPNRFEPFNGDFIQRHAQAASIYNDIHVIHLAPDYSGKEVKKQVEVKVQDGLTEQLIYYPAGKTLWGRIKGHYRQLFLYKQAIRNYMIKNGKPDLVHVQVPMKAGIAAIWFKKQYKIPFVVTEHWGIYNDVAADRFEKRSLYFRYNTKRIFEQAAAFLSVSKYLGEGVNRLVIPKEFTIIPNAVNTDLFFYKEKTVIPFRFIHVSNMVPLKNAEGILRSFLAFLQSDGDAELMMVGDTDPAIRNYAASLNIPGDKISFKGEVPYREVAVKMQAANAFILFSNIENSPCVIGESLCCGLPVIATRTGGVPELVDESNSILADTSDEQALTAAMHRVINQYKKYQTKEIAEKAVAKFSYSATGKQFDTLYRSLL